MDEIDSAVSYKEKYKSTKRKLRLLIDVSDPFGLPCLSVVS